MKIEQFVVGINIWRDASHNGPLVQAGELWRHIGYASRKPLDVARVTYLRKNYHFFETSDFPGFRTAEDDFFLTMKGLELVIKLRRTREANELKKKLVRGLAELERETPGKAAPGAAPLGGMAYYRGIAAEAGKKKEESAGRISTDAVLKYGKFSGDTPETIFDKSLFMAAETLRDMNKRHPLDKNIEYALIGVLETLTQRNFRGLHRHISKDLHSPTEVGNLFNISAVGVGQVISWAAATGAPNLRTDRLYSEEVSAEVDHGPNKEKRQTGAYKLNGAGLKMFMNYGIQYADAFPRSVVGVNFRVPPSMNPLPTEGRTENPPMDLDLSKTAVVAPTRKRPSGKRNSIRRAISAHQVNGAGSN